MFWQSLSNPVAQLDTMTDDNGQTMNFLRLKMIDWFIGDRQWRGTDRNDQQELYDDAIGECGVSWAGFFV